MPATPFDSIHLSALFDAGETARLFTDSAEIRAMMIVEGALAQVQGAQGIIPEISAAAIHRASLECQIDPVSLARATGANGVSTPALVAAFREAMQAPEHAQFLHWGATSQDIQDTALMLRLRQALTGFVAQLDDLLGTLSTLAQTHAALPMAARTYGQHATPTSFGAKVAQWGWPLLEARDNLARLLAEGLPVSLSGASGTSAELGADPSALRAALAEKLGLRDPGRSWHADRGPVLRVGETLTRLALGLGKWGEDLVLATQSGLAEVRLGGTGSSSTMPQKQNPVAPSVMVALARHATGLNATLQGAALHRQQRDGAAWFTEWLVLPQLVLSTAAALGQAGALGRGLHPDATAMQATLEGTGGLLLAEALSFALTDRLPRPKAQAEVKRLCIEARETGQTLEACARRAFPDLPGGFFDNANHLGNAPLEAVSFATAAMQVARG
jgi:3-carboxy-cis,cis-muconate cycloisomerase